MEFGTYGKGFRAPSPKTPASVPTRYLRGGAPGQARPGLLARPNAWLDPPHLAKPGRGARLRLGPGAGAPGPGPGAPGRSPITPHAEEPSPEESCGVGVAAHSTGQTHPDQHRGMSKAPFGTLSSQAKKRITRTQGTA